MSAELYDRLIALLSAEFGADLRGVLLTGSRVHSTPGPTSDLDVHVLTAGTRRQRRNIVLDGVEIEMFINPVFQLPHYFKDGPSSVHMFSFGQAVYDPDGVVARLQQQARALWEAGPAPVEEHMLWHHRYTAADLLRDLHDVQAQDEASAGMLIAALVGRLLDSHYQLRRRWPEKLKRRLRDLERWDPQAAAAARAALECRPLPERVAAVERLAAHVLAPVGGLMPLEWEIPWEEMQP